MCVCVLSVVQVAFIFSLQRIPFSKDDYDQRRQQHRARVQQETLLKRQRTVALGRVGKTPSMMTPPNTDASSPSSLYPLELVLGVRVEKAAASGRVSTHTHIALHFADRRLSTVCGGGGGRELETYIHAAEKGERMLLLLLWYVLLLL